MNTTTPNTRTYTGTEIAVTAGFPNAKKANQLLAKAGIKPVFTKTSPSGKLTHTYWGDDARAWAENYRAGQAARREAANNKMRAKMIAKSEARKAAEAAAKAAAAAAPAQQVDHTPELIGVLSNVLKCLEQIDSKLQHMGARVDKLADELGVQVPDFNGTEVATHVAG